MKDKYPKFKRGEIEQIFKKLSKEEQKFINDYCAYRQVNGLENTNDLRRMIIQIRHIIEMDYKGFIDFENHIKLCLIIKNSHLSNEVKKNIKINLNNFFGEYVFSGWWNKKFIRIYSNKNGVKEDNHKAIPTDAEVKELIKTEKNTFWLTFLLYEEMTGNRIKETREVENERITFNKDGTATIEIFQTKTKKIKYNFVDKQTTDYIKKLQQEQSNIKTYGKYLFNSPQDKNKPISKNAVDKWFKELSIKATGKPYTPYSLRHKKATFLYNLSKNNKISEYTALKLLGHGKSMMATYDKTPKKEEIEILKKQAFNTEISEEKKVEYEKRIEVLENQIEAITKLLIKNANQGVKDIKEKERRTKLVKQIVLKK